MIPVRLRSHFTTIALIAASCLIYAAVAKVREPKAAHDTRQDVWHDCAVTTHTKSVDSNWTVFDLGVCKEGVVELDLQVDTSHWEAK